MSVLGQDRFAQTRVKVDVLANTGNHPDIAGPALSLYQFRQRQERSHEDIDGIQTVYH